MKERLKDILYFENEQLLHNAAERLERGFSIILKVQIYLGNNKWKLGKYQYKMIVPCEDNYGILYSTDVFKKLEEAMMAEYGIYRATQQNAVAMMCSMTADIHASRFGHGYTEEAYGRKSLIPAS